MSKVQGGCLCGAVRYSCDAEPVVTAICQCTHCQKQSGGAYSVNLGIPHGALKYTAGQPKRYRDKGDSGMAVYRCFCGDCGSPIVSEVEATPTLDWLKSGTLDDTTWIKPQVAIWCSSAQNWVELPDSIAQFPEAPPHA
jgi:hypothetical protein